MQSLPQASINKAFSSHELTVFRRHRFDIYLAFGRMNRVETFYKHRAALALNNMAVRLLQRQQFLTASETIRDSTDILKQCFPTTADHSTYSDIENKLKQAEQRVSHLSQLKLKHDSNASENFKINGKNSTLIIFQSDADILCLRKRISECGIDTLHLYPIWIDFQGSGEEKCQDRDLDVDAAIVLYNFGICYMYEAQAVRQNRAFCIASKQRALHLFELAHSILTCNVRIDTEGLIHSDRHTLMIFLATRSLYQLYTELGFHNQAVTASLALMDIWELVEERYASMELFDVYTKPMGASAA
jgi:hypothetical protein